MPTFASKGFPQASLEVFFALFGPANLPPALLARINTEFVRALNAPDVRPKLEDQGMTVVANTPQQFAAMFKESFTIYGRVIKEAGLKPED